MNLKIISNKRNLINYKQVKIISLVEDEDSDVRRSHSVDNENPQTPDESADDIMSEILGEEGL